MTVHQCRLCPRKRIRVVFTDRSEQRQQRATADRTRPLVHPGDTLVRDLQPRPPHPRRPLRFRHHSEHVAGTRRGRKIHHRRRAGMIRPIRPPPHHRGTTRDVRVTVVSVRPRQPHQGRNRAAVVGEQHRRGIRRQRAAQPCQQRQPGLIARGFLTSTERRSGHAHAAAACARPHRQRRR